MRKKRINYELDFIDIVDLREDTITLTDIEYVSQDLKTKLQYEAEFSKNT